MNGKQFLEYMEDWVKKRGFRDSKEALSTALNWQSIFREDLPKDYYHPRDEKILKAGIDLTEEMGVPSVSRQYVLQVMNGGYN